MFLIIIINLTLCIEFDEKKVMIKYIVLVYLFFNVKYIFKKREFRKVRHKKSKIRKKSFLCLIY